jgi:hypothetical protein
MLSLSQPVRTGRLFLTYFSSHYSFVYFCLSFCLFLCTILFSVLVRILCFFSGIFHIIRFMFTYFVHDIPLLHVPAKSAPTFFPSVLAPIMGPCIGLTIMCFILRLRWGRFLSYRSRGVKTRTESKMLEIASFPLSKIHTRSGLPLKKHVGPSHSEPTQSLRHVALKIFSFMGGIPENSTHKSNVKAY